MTSSHEEDDGEADDLSGFDPILEQWMDAQLGTHLRDPEWMIAIRSADEGDPDPLMHAIGNFPFTPLARQLLADLADRRLRRKRGRPRTPLYENPAGLLELATAYVRHRQARLRSAADQTAGNRRSPTLKAQLDNVISEVAGEMGLNEDTLRDFINGRHGSSNRLRRSRARPK